MAHLTNRRDGAGVVSGELFQAVGVELKGIGNVVADDLGAIGIAELSEGAAVAGAHQAVCVDDQNWAAASGYGVVNWTGGFKQSLRRLHLNEFVRVANVLGHKYIGAVVIADHNGRYFEPAPGRNFIVGVTASYRF